MLLHLRPRLLFPFKMVDLIDFEVKQLGLCLKGNSDLTTRRPYPNKDYAVACRKQGHKAIDSIFIETNKLLEEWDTTARWAVNASIVVTHKVHYELLEHEFGAASDNSVLWYADSEELGGWSVRRPQWVRDMAPMITDPVMEIFPRDVKRPMTEDVIEQGLIICRRQTFPMPTLERDRVIHTQVADRVPAAESAFLVG